MQDQYNIAPMKDSVDGAYENKFEVTVTPYVQAKNNEYDDESKSSDSD
jgi:hypothetical protein